MGSAKRQKASWPSPPEERAARVRRTAKTAACQPSLSLTHRIRQLCSGPVSCGILFQGPRRTPPAGGRSHSGASTPACRMNLIRAPPPGGDGNGHERLRADAMSMRVGAAGGSRAIPIQGNSMRAPELSAQQRAQPPHNAVGPGFAVSFEPRRDCVSLPHTLLAPVTTASRATQPAPGRAGARNPYSDGVFDDITTGLAANRSANDHMQNCMRTFLLLFGLVVMVGGGPVIIFVLIHFFNEFPMIPRVMLGIIFFTAARYLWMKKREQQKRQARLLRARTLRRAGEAILSSGPDTETGGDASAGIETGPYFGASSSRPSPEPPSADRLAAQLAAMPAVAPVQPVSRAHSADAELVVEGISVFENPSYSGVDVTLAAGVVDDVPGVLPTPGTVRTFVIPMGVAVMDDV